MKGNMVLYVEVIAMQLAIYCQAYGNDFLIFCISLNGRYLSNEKEMV